MKTRSLSGISARGWLATIAAVVVPVGALGSFAACGDSQQIVTTPITNGIVLFATPTTQLANGSIVKLEVRTTVGSSAGTGTVKLTTTHGTLGGQSSLDVVLDATGVARVDYACDATKDVACLGKQTVTANWNNAIATADVTFAQSIAGVDAGYDAGPVDGGPLAIPGTVSFDGLTCGGGACAFLGLKNSGFNESGTVTFLVKDSSGKPIPNTPVTLKTDGAPTDPSFSFAPNASTDTNGKITALITSGVTIGIFKVHAKVDGVVGLEIDSPPIGIRGSKPANRNVALKCVRKNIPALVANPPPADIPVNCDFRLGDRFGNPVGRSLAVAVKTEAGSAPALVNSVAFAPTGDNASEGTGLFTYRTTALQLPVDTVPNAGEPSSAGRNPRDGMVNILAYVDGEEFFSDANSNGVYDLGEQFYDQAEPFVDANDSDVHDGVSFYYDTNKNGRWDGPNGVWDGNTAVWATTWINYTGVGGTPVFSPASATVEKGSVLDANVFMLDENLNQISLTDATYAVTREVGQKGQFAWNPVPKADDYGFKLTRDLVVPNTTTACGAAPRCVYRTLFSNWADGNIGRLQITGAAAADATLPEVQRYRARVQINASAPESVMNVTMK
jgi:hypothetical protein